MMLFPEDRESKVFSEIRDLLEDLDIDSLTPLEALNVLNGLKGKLKK